MTVIAWDGETFACDRQATREGLGFRTQKMHNIRDGAAAIIGDYANGMRLINWLWSSSSLSTNPEKHAEGDEAELIILRSSGIYSLNDSGIEIPLFDSKLAFGSGRDYALATMYLGKDAISAVRVASIFDIYCGAGISYVKRDFIIHEID